MIEAYISGSKGMAALIKGVEAQLYQVGKLEPTLISSHVAQQIFSSATDLITLNKTSKDRAIKTLYKENNKSSGLVVLLTILDSDIGLALKIPLIGHLNSLFEKDDDLYPYLCNVMFTRPLPDNSINSIPEGMFSSVNKVYELVDLLFSCQDRIKKCSDIFTSICDKRKLDSKQSNHLEGMLVNQSFFYSLVAEKADIKFFNNTLFTLITKLKSADISDYIQLVACIKSDFKPLINKAKDSGDSKAFAHEVAEIKSNDNDKYKVKIKKSNNRVAYHRVITQLRAVKTKLRSHSISQAKSLATELIKFQVANGDSEFAAQSLCQLSEYAKKLKQFELQLEWALEATKVAPLDFRTFGHVADAYIHLENINDAQHYFEICLKAQDDNRIYGLSGLARIERSRYNFGAAMEYIETAIDECGKDSTPYLIRAELLRDQHLYSDSEKAYDYICREYPELSLAHCGKASVLAEQKKFVEAEAVYRCALSNYPNTVDKKNILSGLGFLMGRLGRFKESHQLLDECIKLSTYEDIVPHISQAKVMEMQGRFKDAEKKLEDLVSCRVQFSDVVEQSLNLYLKTNQLGKAQDLYDKTSAKIKESDLVRIRYSQLLKQQNKFELALQVIDKLRQDKPKYMIAMNERAAIFKTQGLYKQALLQYREVLKIQKFDRIANLGVQAINYAFNRTVTIKNVIGNVDIVNPKTIEDYQTIGNIGLLKLSKGQIKEGKELLLQSYNCDFKSLQTKFNSGLSLASLMLNQKGAALKQVKKPTDIISSIQKAVVYGEQGNKAQVVNNLNKLNINAPPFTNRILEMIRMKYISAANDDYISQDNCISQEDIYHEQLKNMLIAA